MQKINIFWFRRDLRLFDNAGLYHSLKSQNPVLPIFIFDKNILEKLPNKKDARVEFIYREINRLAQELELKKSSILVKFGRPIEVWKELIANYNIAEVYTNRDYEGYAKQRDERISRLLMENGIDFHTYKDHVIFEGNEVLKNDGSPYKVFTPYSKRWKAKLDSKYKVFENSLGKNEEASFYLTPYQNEKYLANLLKMEILKIPSLEEIGFLKSETVIPQKTVVQDLIRKYDETRNFPAINGTSKLGIHFRFGTISIREKARKAQKLNDTFLNELIWRDFYAMILDHFPKVENNAFRPKYDEIDWRNNEKEFEAWCNGVTGFPLVDAGMRELNNTGYMHNRVRMITASFLTKHLLIDWRWGEAYFAEKLLDFDLASNNGGWQWAAGSGTDAAPYFRIFNPTAQMTKFDKEKKYIKKWLPDFGTEAYPEPIVNHKEARERCLEKYKEVI